MKNGLNTISSIIKGSTPIQIIKKGLTTVYEAFKNLIVSGAFPISLPNSIGRDLVDYKIYGQSIQKSKNIFPTLETHQTAVGVTLSYDKSDNTFVLNGTSTSSKSFEIITVGQNYEEFRKGDSYTLSTYLVSGSTNTTQGPFIYIKDSYTNSNYVQRAVGSIAQTPYVFTYNGNGYINRIAISINGTGHTYENYKFKIQLEKGMSATEFEPHLNPTPDTPVEVKSVGDLTNNLIPFPYNSNNGHESNGITYTINTDGSVTANGTAIGTSSFYLIRNQANILKSGVEYTISGCTGGSPNTYEIRVQRTGTDYYRTTNTSTTFTFAEGLDMSAVSAYIVIRAGQVVDNLTFYPKIEEGLEATEYEPYGYRIPIISRGKNLIPYPWVSNSGDYFTIKNDGGIEVNVDASEKYIDFNFHLSGTLKAGTYIYSGGHKNLLLICGYTNSNNAPQWLVFSLNSPVTISKDINYTRMYLQINPNNEVKGTFYIQLEKGTTATEYEPYVEPVTTNIYLDEPLRRINGYSDYIDLSESRVVRKIAKTVLRNTEIIGEVKNKPYPYAFVVLGESGKAKKNNELCTHFRAQSDFSFRVEGNNVFRVLNSESNNETRIAFRLYLNGQIISDVTEVKNYAEEQYNNGTPVIFYYAVADGLETKEIIELPNIPTFKGTTVIDSNAEVIPSNAEIEYIGK